jgi:HEAT repeat protein
VDRDIILRHLQRLSSPEFHWRRRAALDLAQVGPDAADAAPMLTSALDDPEMGIRSAAALALWRIERDAEQTIRRLTFILERCPALPDPIGVGQAVLDAAAALGEIGPAARPALPALRGALPHAGFPIEWPAVGIVGSETEQFERAVAEAARLIESGR